MKNKIILLILLSFIMKTGISQSSIDSILPVRGLCISAPKPEGIDTFINFIENDLTKKLVNTLILRVDFNYQYKSYPNLRDSDALSAEQVKRIVIAARKSKIRIIPQINLLGHQSWASDLNKLLMVYPQFDETPWVSMPANYVWPNADGLYCKSYCPLHPELHKVVFALIDELVEAFEADAFHAGMDEVFYIGEDKCPRCKGLDKSRLFADEVARIHDHLSQKGFELWIWGDRLLDGRTTGLGMWEASMNNTYRAIDMIPNDVVICDWHYDKAEPTAAYFALKGFKVVTCAWNNPDIALQQLNLVLLLRQNSNPAIAGKIAGIAETIWSPAELFLDYYSGRLKDNKDFVKPVDCYKALFDKIDKIALDKKPTPSFPSDN
jgi:Glycosyl hydrolase family 20, catalytic domain